MGDEVVEGEMVAALVGAANRDPDVFDDPDRFLVDRPNADAHLSFGWGVHYCLGRRVGVQSGMHGARHALQAVPRPAPWPRRRSGTRRCPTRRLDRLDVTLA